jgi:hypothetical protein
MPSPDQRLRLSQTFGLGEDTINKIMEEKEKNTMAFIKK